MTAAADSGSPSSNARSAYEPSSYLVFNTATGNWKVFPSKVKALVVSRSANHYRMFPVWERGVDSKFIDFVHWAVAA